MAAWARVAIAAGVMAWTAPLLAQSEAPVAQGMTIEQFLGYATLLRQRLQSAPQGVQAARQMPEFQAMGRELAGAMRAYRADLASSAVARRQPRSCPPPPGQTHLGSSEIIAAFEAVPAEQRGMSVREAFFRLMDQRYPCTAQPQQ